MSEITEIGMRFVTEDTKEELIEDASFLMNSAITFIQELERIVNEYQHIIGVMHLGTDSLSRLRCAMEFSQNKLQDIINAQYTFEEQVNNFLGRQIHFAWIDVKTGEVLFAKETSAKAVYELLSEPRSGGKSGKIKIRNAGQLATFKSWISSLPSFMAQEYENEINKRISDHQDLFKEVMTRYDANNDSNNHPWYDLHEKTVYWRRPPDGAANDRTWAWSEKKKKGIISQGYLDLIFNSTQTLTNNEFNIGHFMMDYVGINDRIPGIVKGDLIVRNTDNKVQVAIKSNTLFSTAAIGPYLTVAYKIISFYNNLSSLTKANVEAILGSIARYDQSILNASQTSAQIYLDQIFLNSQR